MVRERRRVLVGATLVVATAGALVLTSILTTIALAAAASYALLPVHRSFRRRGLPGYWSAVATSLVAAVVALIATAPVLFAAFVRRDAISATLGRLRGQVTLFFVGETPVVFDLGTLRRSLVPEFGRVVELIVRRLPTLSAKLVVFAFVVFALLYYHERIRGSAQRIVPGEYHDVLDHAHRRVRGTLFDQYVLAFIGGIVTFLFAVVIFTLVGHSFPVAVSFLAATLWILPVVNVSAFVMGAAAYYLWGGAFITGVLVAVAGAIFLVAVPGTVVARLSDRLGNPTGLSEPVYFVGFIGGGLTVGPAGIVIGPVALTVLLALRDSLADGGPSLTDVTGTEAERR